MQYVQEFANKITLPPIPPIVIQYQLYIKAAVLSIFCIIAFLIGRHSKVNQMQKSLDKLNNASHFRDQLNKQLTLTKAWGVKVKKALRVMLFVNIAIVLLLGVSLATSLGKYLHYLLILKVLAAFIIVHGLLYLISKLLQLRQKRQTAALTNLYSQEDKQVYTVIDLLGEKLRGKLKTYLQEKQRQKFQINRKKDCELFSCRQTTKLLTEAQTSFDQLVVKMTGYKWCQKCCTNTKQLQSFLKVDLKNLKTQGLSLDEMKRLFNKLLQIYSTKKKQLECVCPIQCSKGFCESIRPISQQFYRQLEFYDKKLELLRMGK